MQEPPGPPEEEEPAGEEQTGEAASLGRDATAFARRNATPRAVAVMAALLVAGFAGVALLVVTTLGGGGAGGSLQNVNSSDGTLAASLPEGWSVAESTSELADGTRTSVEATDPAGAGFVRIVYVNGSPGDPILRVPDALDALVAGVTECAFAEAESLRVEEERVALMRRGQCPGGPALAAAGATFTEAGRDEWTIVIRLEGGEPEPDDILRSIRLGSHDATGAAV